MIIYDFWEFFLITKVGKKPKSPIDFVSEF